MTRPKTTWCAIFWAKTRLRVERIEESWFWEPNISKRVIAKAKPEYKVAGDEVHMSPSSDKGCLKSKKQNGLKSAMCHMLSRLTRGAKPAKGHLQQASSMRKCDIQQSYAGNQLRSAIAYDIRFLLFLTGWLDDVAFSETQPGLRKFLSLYLGFSGSMIGFSSSLARDDPLVSNPQFQNKKANFRRISFWTKSLE